MGPRARFEHYVTTLQVETCPEFGRLHRFLAHCGEAQDGWLGVQRGGGLGQAKVAEHVGDVMSHPRWNGRDARDAVHGAEWSSEG